MKIHVGSKNKTKLQSVIDTVALYPSLFPNAEIFGVDVAVEEFGHPKDLDETVSGAIARAKAAFPGSDYGFGLEGGLMLVPHSKTGYMEVNACAVYDGEKTYIGLGPAFEYPQNVLELILSGKADASQAFKLLGLTPHEKIGAVAGGISGYLTAGRLPREDFMKYSIIMALVQLEKPELY